MQSSERQLLKFNGVGTDNPKRCHRCEGIMIYLVRKPQHSCLPRPRSGPGSADRDAGEDGNEKYQLLIPACRQAGMAGSKPCHF